MSEALLKYRQRCFEDLQFCERNEVKIRALDENGAFRLIPMDSSRRPSQQKLQAEYEKQMAERGFCRIIIVKSRKDGVSTKIQTIGWHYCQTHEYTHFLTVAHNDPATRTIFKIQRTIVENADHEHVFPKLKGKPKGQLIEWANGSWSECRTQGGSEDKERGGTPNFLHLSEIPSWDADRVGSSAEGVAQSLLTSVPTNSGVVFIESTAKGVGNFFHSKWLDAVNDVPGNQFVPMFFSWIDNPDYQIPAATKEAAARERTLCKLLKQAHADGHTDTFNAIAEELRWDRRQRDEAVKYDLSPEQIRFWQVKLVSECSSNYDRFDEEWPRCADDAFVASGRRVFSGHAITERRDQILSHRANAGGEWPWKGRLHMGQSGSTITAEIQHTADGAWEFYRDPREVKLAIIACDVAEGGTTPEDDFSCIQILDANTMEQVGEYLDKVPPDVLAEEAYKAWLLYGRRTRPVGVEVPGAGLAAIEYTRIMHPDMPLFRRFSVLGELGASDTDKIGYPMEVRTRGVAVSMFEISFRNGDLTVHSLRLLDQMQGLQRVGSKVMAVGKRKDDAVMAMAQALDIRRVTIVDAVESSATNDVSIRYVSEWLEGQGIHPVFGGFDTFEVSHEEADEWF